MFKCLAQASIVALLGLTTPVTGSVAVAQNDPSGGFCDELDPSGGLFATCIQAYSALNRLEHLEDVGANENAVAKAELAFSAVLATYAELPGGGTVPGLLADKPILAVAYINRDNNPGYLAGYDTLIAKLVDTREDGMISIGDTITTHKYPLDVDATTEGSFRNLTHIVSSIAEVHETWFEVGDDAGNRYQFGSNILGTPSCDWYWEATEAGTGGPQTFFQDNDESTVCHSDDWIQVDENSPSDPDTPVTLFTDKRRTNDIFLDVDFLF
jgi:hypothetical protein